ncbi:MAG TPA: PIG-L family deacetylase [Vicinamibacterales bacterium]|jgi:LmbE family N-acetylglucosaminyl deacetylase
MYVRRSAVTGIGAIVSCGLAISASVMFPRLLAQGAQRTLVAVFAHADDEGSAAPILARYARDGVQVYLVIATDGAQGGSHTTIPPGPELARARSEEARCATDALGIHPPILLGFPDAGLGSYLEDRARLFHVTARIQEELQRLHPDALITWGPDGGSGHPDHRLVSSIVTQLVRAGAPGAPQRLFYVSLPEEAVRTLNSDSGEPAYLAPSPKYITARIPFSPADFDASRRSMACHKTQYPEDVVEKLSAATRDALKGELPLSPWLPAAATTDLFR